MEWVLILIVHYAAAGVVVAEYPTQGDCRNAATTAITINHKGRDVYKPNARSQRSIATMDFVCIEAPKDNPND